MGVAGGDTLVVVAMGVVNAEPPGMGVGVVAMGVVTMGVVTKGEVDAECATVDAVSVADAEPVAVEAEEPAVEGVVEDVMVEDNGGGGDPLPPFCPKVTFA